MRRDWWGLFGGASCRVMSAAISRKLVNRPRINSEALSGGGWGGCYPFAARTGRAVVDEATHHIDGYPPFTVGAAPPLPFGAIAEEVFVAHQPRIRSGSLRLYLRGSVVSMLMPARSLGVNPNRAPRRAIVSAQSRMMRHSGFTTTLTDPLTV